MTQLIEYGYGASACLETGLAWGSAGAVAGGAATIATAQPEIGLAAGFHHEREWSAAHSRARREALRPAPDVGYQRPPDTTECRTSVRRMETVLVGANRSETAARAVERAGTVAASMGAGLVVVTAYGTDDVDEIGVGSDTYVVSTAQEATAFAEQTAARLGTEYGILARGMAASGKPERVILDAAKQVDASVIVVGNVRMQGPGRLLGSVANHIAHHAPCDVYIVKTA
jgi:nucleotide-binding universal stress UspA family protein